MGRHVRVFCHTSLEKQWFAAANAKMNGETFKLPDDFDKEAAHREYAMKQAMLRLIVSYPYAIMYHLRGEDPLSKPFLTNMIPMMNSANNPNGYGLNGRTTDAAGKPVPMPTTAGLRPPYRFNATITNDIGSDRHYATTFNMPGAWAVPEEFNIPTQIVELLARWVQKYDKEKSALLGFLNSFIDAQSQLERILTTPLPIAYVCHLKQILLVYMICLPFQLILIYGYYSILITGLVAFVMYGIESIGVEIENPFGLCHFARKLTCL